MSNVMDYKPRDTTDRIFKRSLSTHNEATEDITHKIAHAAKLEGPETYSKVFLAFFEDIGPVKNNLK